MADYDDKFIPADSNSEDFVADAFGPDSAVPSMFIGMLFGGGPPRWVANRDTWRGLRPISNPVSIPPPPVSVSWADLRKLAVGYVPVRDDDPWLAYMEDDRLFIHRSDNGCGVYELTFSAKGRSVKATSVMMEAGAARNSPDFDPTKEAFELLLVLMHVAGEPTPKDHPSLFTHMVWGSDGVPERIATRTTWGKNEPIVKPFKIAPPPVIISRADMQMLATGYVPREMNDKWTSFMEDNRLFIHRSWSGHGIYEVEFAAKDYSWTPHTGYQATEVLVESDSSRWNFDPSDYDLYNVQDEVTKLIAHICGPPMPISIPRVVRKAVED